METVTDQPAEREPDNVTPAYAAAMGQCPCGAEAGYLCQNGAGEQLGEPHPERLPAMPDVRHFAALADAYTVCGLERATVRWTDDPATPVDCPACSAVLVDEQLAEPEPERLPVVHYRVAIGDPIPCGATVVRASTANPAEVTCPGCRIKAASSNVPTIGLEAMTGPLRAISPHIGMAAKVGVVIRRGDAAYVIESDVTWSWTQLKPHQLLAEMLRALDGDAAAAGVNGARVLMPGPDVLAALDGKPDAQFWTAPVPVRAEDVQEGWIAVGYSGPDIEEPVTGRNPKCADPDCPWPGDCTALTIGDDKPQHFADWTLLTVRIPCAVTR